MKLIYDIAHGISVAGLPPITRCQTHGTENIPASGAFLVASNHRSNLDVIFISAFIPRVVHWMAKIELWSDPIFAVPVRVFEAFPVRRGESDLQALRTANALLTAGEVIGVFPEGTRSKTGGLQAGNPGAALIAMRANVPVLPVAITGSGAYRPGDLTTRARGRVQIYYGPPLLLERSGARVTTADLQRGHATVMGAIAAMLPPEQRGEWSGDLTPGPFPTKERAP